MKKLLLIGVLCVRATAWTFVAEDLGGWATHNLKIYFNPTDCTVAESTLKGIIDNAIKLWNTTPAGSISLERVSVNATVSVVDFIAKNSNQVPVILCDTDIKGHNGVSPDVVPATTRIAGSKGHLNYAGILLNAQSGTGAEISQLKEYELSVTISHELGHVLGLGHSGSQDALMYYSIAKKSQAVLTQDDIDGVSFLYPKNELTLNPFGCASVHRDSVPSGVGGIWFLMFIAFNICVGRFLGRGNVLGATI